MSAPAANELIDVVDEKNEPVGQIARRDVFATGSNFRTVAVFVLDHDDRLLLQQLGGTRDRHPLQWGSSVAGYLHAGESYRAAAQRRLLEEIGLSARLTEVGVVPICDEGVTKFVGLFLARSDSARIAEPEHIEQLDFVPLQSIQDATERRPKDFTATFKALIRTWLDTGLPRLSDI